MTDLRLDTKKQNVAVGLHSTFSSRGCFYQYLESLVDFLRIFRLEDLSGI